MASAEDTLSKIGQTNGYIGSCVVDSESGMMLASDGGGFDLEVAAAGNTEVVRAKLATMKSLGLDDSIQDILITLNKQYHLIRLVQKRPSLFIYVVLDKERSNLAMARHNLATAESEMDIS